MVSENAGRSRAQRLYPVLGLCEECRAAPAVDRHHRDGDTMNNTPENIARLCRRCHMAVDGRTAAEASRRLSRTYCPAGHELTPANTYHHPRGWRACRECARLSRRRYRDRSVNP